MKHGTVLMSHLAAGLLGLAVMLSSGCVTLPSFQGRSVVSDSGYSANDELYVVDIHPNFGKPTRWEGPIMKGMTVQSALEASSALGKIRNADVELIRPVPENGTVLRMPVELQPNKRLVKYEQDYAILPGDKIIVTSEAANNPFESALSKLR